MGHAVSLGTAHQLRACMVLRRLERNKMKKQQTRRFEHNAFSVALCVASTLALVGRSTAVCQEPALVDPSDYLASTIGERPWPESLAVYPFVFACMPELLDQHSLSVNTQPAVVCPLNELLMICSDHFFMLQLSSQWCFCFLMICC